MEQHRYEVVAHNTATSSSNRIHDDEVARRYGFRGGLVPGVDVYAYMTTPVVERWGLDWLRSGRLQARFLSPVYDGERIAVTATTDVGAEGGADADEPALTVEVEGEDGRRCASGRATLPSATEDRPTATITSSTDDAGFADAAAVDGELPDASPESLAVGTTLVLPARSFAFEPEMVAYLADVRDDLPIYGEHRIAHPGWLLRHANRVLASNVALGPWIHVESDLHLVGVLAEGEPLATRAVVTREWERKGHRFVALDVELLGDDRRVARIDHTAIYRPRPAEHAATG